MSYYSDIDLGGLSEAPRTSDPVTFPDFLDVYNAIHLLAQYVESYGGVDGKFGPGTTPWDNMPFKTFLELPAINKISKGMAVSVKQPDLATINNTSFDSPAGFKSGVQRGWYKAYDFQSTSEEIGDGGYFGTTTNTIYTAQGVAFNDANPGERVRIGFGPAILHIPQIDAGVKLYAGRVKDNDGNFYVPVPPNYIIHGSRQIAGYAIADEAVFFNPPIMLGHYSYSSRRA